MKLSFTESVAQSYYSCVKQDNNKRHVHPTAIIHPQAQLAPDVKIGPNTIVGPDVSIDEGTVVASNVIIDGHTHIGKNNQIFSGSHIGNPPQDLKYLGEKTSLRIGCNNIIREHVTISIGTSQGGGLTSIGDNNLLMIGAHIAHDVWIGHHNVIANQVQIGGHVIIDDWVTIGGLTGIHQFIQIGNMAMIGCNSKVNKHIIPFSLVDGNPARRCSINHERLKRRQFSTDQIKIIKSCFKSIADPTITVPMVVDKLQEKFPNQLVANQIVKFLLRGNIKNKGCYR